MMKEHINHSHVQALFMSSYITLISGIFISNYFIHIGFNAFHFGLFHALTYMAGLLAFPLSFKINNADKKQFFSKHFCMSLLFFSLFIIIAFIPNISVTLSIWLSLLTMGITIIFIQIANLVLFPWLHESVGSAAWNHFFSFRLVVIAIPATLLPLLGSSILDTSDNSVTTVMFLIALGCGLLSILFMSRVPQMKLNPMMTADQHRPLIIIKRFLRNRSIFLLMIYTLLLSCSIGFIAPLVYKYLLSQLHMNSSTISMYQVAMSLSSVFAYPLFGYLCTKFSNLVMLRYLSFLLIVVPVLLIVATPAHPVITAFVFVLGFNEGTGILFSGIFLALTGVMLDTADNDTKTIFLAFFGFVKALSLTICSYIGGWIAQQGSWTNFSFNGYQISFAIGLFFIIVASYPIYKIKHNI